jgi:FAD/FMN-containing dehydrogenase
MVKSRCGKGREVSVYAVTLDDGMDTGWLENREREGELMLHPKNRSRRSFLKGVVAGASVIGFDLSTRGWLTAGGVPTAVAMAPDFPAFDGTLYTDPSGSAALDTAADDFGHIVSHRPIAVLSPRSIDDIVAMMRFARQHGLHVSARGQGHATQGQCQNEGGVVIDMSSLNTIHEINSDNAWVDAGITWFELIQQTSSQGLTPPTITDYVHLSIGGTLSVGGIGGQGFVHGPQVEQVLALTVVTGQGERVTCSRTHEAALFDAVRAGLGQFGIIVQARIKLVQAPQKTRFYNLPYPDVTTFMADQEFLIGTNRFDYVEGFALENGNNGWMFLIEAVKYVNPGDEIDDAALLADLHFLPAGETMEERFFFNPAFDPGDPATFDFVNRVSVLVAALQAAGLWQLPHPWFNGFLPSQQAPTLMTDLFDTLKPNDLGPGSVVIIYPFNSDKFHAPFMRVPAGDTFFSLALLRTATDQASVDAAIVANAQLRDAIVALGGKRYPIDSVPMTKQDWHKHFQPRWGAFRAAKQRFDPDHIMTPGQGIF